MALQRTGVGIDLGEHSVKVVQLNVTSKGAFIQNALYFDHDDLRSRDVDPDDRAAVAKFLKAQMVERGISTQGVVLGISGSDSILRYTSIPPVPAWRLKVIMGYEVTEVSERIGEKLASDFRVLPTPREMDDDQVVLVGLAKEAPLEELLADMDAAGILVETCVPAPLALYAGYEAFGRKSDPEDPDDNLVIFADIGKTSLDCAMLLNDSLIFARSVSFGGETLTETVARDLEIDRDRAELLKIQRGTLDIRNVPDGAEQLSGILRGGGTQLVSLIQSNLRFCRTQTGVALPSPSRIELSGGGSQLTGLATFLERGLKAPVELFKPQGVAATGDLGGKAGEIYSRSPGRFALAMGLAVAGVRDDEVTLHIIPESYRERRRFRERTVFLYAAGAMLVLALILAGLDGWLEKSAAAEQVSKLQGALRSLRNDKSTMEANAQENARARQRVNRILREIEAASFQAYLFDYFQTELRPEIRFARLRMEVEPDLEETDFNYRLIAECTADNSDDNALIHVDELRERLTSDHRIAGVSIENTRPEGTTFRFDLVLTPSFQTYQS